jgi:predicted CoA-binding protein
MKNARLFFPIPVFKDSKDTENIAKCKKKKVSVFWVQLGASQRHFSR